MANRKISDDIKQCALDLWGLGWTLDDICQLLQVSKRSCYRWHQIFDQHGTVSRPPSPFVGRVRLLTRAALTALETLFAEDSDLYLDEACTWLGVEHGITISPSALSRNLQDAGLTRKILRKLAAERNEQQREEFKASLQTDFVGDASEFIVIDETSKNERTYARRYGRAPRGQRASIIDVFARGSRYSLCAAMTVDGYIAARAILGSYDAEEFYNFIFEEIFLLMNPYLEPCSVLVLDNCRIHHNPDLRDLIENAGCVLLFLPPYSPDLTPIEESFSALKAYIQRNGDQLRQNADPIQSLLEATSCITPEKAKSWFKHAGYITEQ